MSIGMAHRVQGKDQGHLLMSLSGAFTTSGIEVVSATIANDDGKARASTGRQRPSIDPQEVVGRTN